MMMSIETLKNVVLQEYGENGLKFLNRYNSDLIFIKRLTEDACFFGEYPTLSELSNKFDAYYAPVWVMFHLHDLSEYCGAREKLSGHALQQCANVIAQEFCFLKVTELMLFFYRFKSGRYGRFYGSVDPLVITTALRDFIKERVIAYDKHEQEERKRQREEEDAKRSKETWEDYCMKEYGEIRPKPWEHPFVPPKKKPRVEASDPAEVVRIAKSLLNDPKADEYAKKRFREFFKKKYGIEVSDYIKKHDK